MNPQSRKRLLYKEGSMNFITFALVIFFAFQPTSSFVSNNVTTTSVRPKKVCSCDPAPPTRDLPGRDTPDRRAQRAE
jgi:hypothetical protein